MRPTDAEIFALLYRASWVVQSAGAKSTPEERQAMATEMREMAQAIQPFPTSDMMAGAAEYYVPGRYNGD